MFNEISKILKSIKKGVVIVENGEPSYVLIPFKDFANYQMQAGSKEDLEGVEFFSDEAGFKKNAVSRIDDVSLIQNLLDYESASEALENKGRKNEYDFSLVSGKNIIGDKEIRLEDLPF